MSDERTVEPGFGVYWWHHLGAVVVVPEGQLDAVSYGRLRSAMMKVAVDEPRAVIVDVDGLSVDRTSALALFPAVGTELSTWPGLPLLLVASEETSMRMLAEYRMPRFLPVLHSIDAAVAAIGSPPPRQVARIALPNGYACLRLARAFVRRCCYRWRLFDDRTVDAIWIANELLENTVKHTFGAANLRVELRNDRLTVAVYDDDPMLPWLIEDAGDGVVHGLSVVEHLSRVWGSSPTPGGGKVVWAVL
jgi:hypothetical protein